MLLLRDADGRVLLERRPASGVWSGMWSLPEVADHDGARAFVATRVRADFDANTPLPLIEHGFSHYRLHIAPLLWDGVAPATRIADGGEGNDASGAQRWASRESLADIGLPAPVRKLLDALPS
jgi:A/G-specific adenine glycosylase